MRDLARRRTFEVYDYSAGRYFKPLEQLLGPSEVDRRLARIDREIRIESGIYLDQWVIPRRSWWLGLREALDLMRNSRSFKRSITPAMERPLQTAVKLYRLDPGMPDWKRDEFRSRILSDEYMEPVLFEIDIASHYWLLGYDIEWIESRSDTGERTPEFAALSNEKELEIECKAKQADAGRKVERASFYRLVDLVLPVLTGKSLTGSIFLTLPSRLPNDPAWREAIASSLDSELNEGKGLATLDGGEELEFSLDRADKGRVAMARLVQMADLRNHPYAHNAVTGQRDGDYVTDPIVFRVESSTPDQFLMSVLDGLRDANRQFLGSRSGVICCHIPEIASFEGLQADSAIQRMTARFFERHARDFIYAVSYVSEARRELQGRIILSDMPSLSFRNTEL